MTMMTSAEYHRRLTSLLARPMFMVNKKTVGFDIPRGWLALVERLVADLEALPNGGKLRCIQVKEKFGGLRFYLASEPPRIDLISCNRILTKRAGGGPSEAGQIIALAEQVSRSTCELCGEPGRIIDVDGWYTALCPEHAAMNAGQLSALLSGEEK